MRTTLPPLTSLVAFDAVARRLSFTSAADELHLTPSAISHQITNLEAFLGIRLFERNARSVALTEAGAAYLKRIGGALATIGAASDDARKGVRNSLHVHSTPSFASLWLMPRLKEFAAMHPKISLSLSASAQHSDFSVGLVDIDIRYGVPNWPLLTVEPIHDERIAPLASPEFVQRYSPRTPADLSQLPLIQSMVSVVQWSQWFASRGLPAPSSFAFRFDRAFMALDAAVQGLGVALESTFIGAPHLQAGRLQRVFGRRWYVPIQGHFLVYPARHAERMEVTSFVTWLRRRARGTAR